MQLVARFAMRKFTSALFGSLKNRLFGIQTPAQRAAGAVRNLFKIVHDDTRTGGQAVRGMEASIQRFTDVAGSVQPSLGITIETRGVREAARALDGLIDCNKYALMQRIVLTVEAIAKREAPVRTGALRRSINSRVERGGDVAIVGTNLKYARAVHEGRGAVVAKGKALRIPLKSGVIYRKQVGPARANPFLTRAFAQARPQIERELKAYADTMLADVASQINRGRR